MIDIAVYIRFSWHMTSGFAHPSISTEYCTSSSHAHPSTPSNAAFIISLYVQAASFRLTYPMYMLFLCLHFLVRISGAIVLPQHNLPLLLRARMLHPHLLRHLVREFANEPGIPELRCYAQVLAAAHQGVGLAALGRRGNAVRVEVLLLAASYGNKTRSPC
jgi:hypothetical protein